MDFHGKADADISGVCPVHHAHAAETAAPDGVMPEAVLVLAETRRMVMQRTVTEAGTPRLVLYYEDKEVAFDEPHLFGFAEQLARQGRFVAGAAAGWGEGLTWNDVQPLLTALRDAGILTDDAGQETGEATARSRPSPLPQAPATVPRNWSGDCAAITSELAGRAVDPYWLELIVPVFRVAHIARDGDGRQVGEANVFPRALRLDTPTDWMACPFPGTRYNSDRPMNTTALKAMREHWTEMMAALKVIRAGFLKRFPEAADGWTVAHVERLATLVLAVPTFQIVKSDGNDALLHPALSSLFRVTDGLRMATHQMMFVPVGEPAVPPSTPVTAQSIFDYAERNYSFHSDTGVCAGPAHMVLEFIETLMHGEPDGSHVFTPDVRWALDDLDAAFDYGLRGLRAHAALFAFWPEMARAYEAIAEVAADAVAAGHLNFSSLHARFGAHLGTIRRVTLLGSEDWRQGREAAYAEIFDLCGRGIPNPGPTFSARTAAVASLFGSHHRQTIGAALRAQLGGSGYTAALVNALSSFVEATHRLIVVAADVQTQLARSLGRAEPRHGFSAADIGVHPHLLGRVPQRLPFLFDEIEDALGLGFDIDSDGIRVVLSHLTPKSAANSGR